MRIENELMLELCKFIRPEERRIKDLLQQKPDMAYVLGSLLYNRMGGTAYHTLKATGLLDATNREFRNSLQMVYSLQVDKTMEYRNALAELSLLLKEIPVRYALLKGAHLCGLYPIGLRTSNDIDLLINKDSIGTITEILLDNQFEQGYIYDDIFVPATRREIIAARMNRGETVPFIKKIDGHVMKFLEIDLNYSLDYQAMDKEDTVGCMLQRSEPLIKTTMENLFTLSSEDFIIHLCAHLYKEATTFPWVLGGRDLSLYKFSDLYLLYEKGIFSSAEKIVKLVKRIHYLKQQKACYYSFRNLCVLYDLHDGKIESFLSMLDISDMKFMQQIYRPDEKKHYQYNMDYLSWFFCPDRAAYLEVAMDEK